jgi:hypothetical protein
MTLEYDPIVERDHFEATLHVAIREWFAADDRHKHCLVSLNHGGVGRDYLGGDFDLESLAKFLCERFYKPEEK